MISPSSSLSRKARRRASAAKIEAFEARFAAPGSARALKRAAKAYGKLARRYEDEQAIAEGLEELEGRDYY